MKDFKIIGNTLGYILVFLGIFSIIPILISFLFKEAMEPFIITSSIFLSAGCFLLIICWTDKEIKFKHAMCSAALAWLIVPLISTVPLLMMTELDFLSAFFETMAGWSGTGLTMIAYPSHLKFSIQFWRSFMQWIGGVGVIVLSLAILARPGTASFNLYKSEARKSKMHPTIVSTVRTIWWIFILYTFLGAGLFWLVGMPIWEAVNHAMTGISTGGFSVVDGSIGSYHNPLIELATLPLMLFGAIAFVAHYDLLRGKIKKFFADTQNNSLFIVSLIGVVFLTLVNLGFYGNLLDSMKYSIFQFLSAITCTGFQTFDVGKWNITSKLILSFAMILGGAAGSTAGGIKLIRGEILFKKIRWEIRKIFLPVGGTFSYKVGDKSLTKDEVSEETDEASMLLVLWAILLFIGILVLLNTVEAGLADVIFEVTSAQGNVGLSTGITNVGMSPVAKVMLIINMWAGRLEIIPILVLIRSIIRHGKVF